MVDAQEQYSQQPCLVINGMAKPGHEEGTENSDDVKQIIETLEKECRISQDVIKNNLDKTHHIGQPDEYGKQLRIVFRKHKYHRNSYIERQKHSGKPVQIKVKLQPSLTRHPIRLLKFTNPESKGAKNIKFGYADMHGALKAMLKHQ